MSDTAVWAIKQAADGTYTVTFPTSHTAVLGFDTKEDAHGWVLDYIVEFNRMRVQVDMYAAERARGQEYARMLQVAPLMDVSTKSH